MKLYNYNNFLNESKFDHIHKICEEYNIDYYTINPDGSIDVDDDVYLSGRSLDVLPLKFNRVTGFFDCSVNNLISLEGCPNYVRWDFDCDNNQLTSLIGCPNTIDRGNLYFNDNQISDFNGFPEFCEGYIFFNNNPVYSLLKNIALNQRVGFIQLLNEYDAIRNGKTIIRVRLEEAYYGIGMELPDDIKIEGYEII